MNNPNNQSYNPDVLSCLANLSNDEVFTPPEIANAMLDLLPQEIFRDPNAKFLDPACKSGVFLREIAKRLIEGLKDKIPDLQERVNHIFTNQLYAIAITELTSLLSRRSVYCSKDAGGKYSVAHFEKSNGNIFYTPTKHLWIGGKCLHCGASQAEYGNTAREGIESHAYQFIHNAIPGEIEEMKFDVIIGNPPYQLSDGGNGASASPIYHLFVNQGKILKPHFLIMITPSRYLAGGKGLDSFRNSMLNDNHIRKMIDYINAKDCFPDNSIGGGVNYFLWDRDYVGDCEYTTVIGNKRDVQMRKLNEFPVFVRQNKSVSIIHKIQKHDFKPLANIVSSRNPFGLPTSMRGKEKAFPNQILLYSSDGKSFISEEEVIKGKDLVQRFKVMISRIIYEHAAEPDDEGMFRVLSRIQTLMNREVCTDSYLILGSFDNEKEANNLNKYLRSKFVRYLISQTLSSINLSKDKFLLVPLQDFSKSWTDEELYKKYNLSPEEIDFIESMIRPME